MIDPIQENYLNPQSITWSNIINTGASFLSLDGWSASHHKQLGVAPLSIHVYHPCQIKEFSSIGGARGGLTEYSIISCIWMLFSEDLLQHHTP